jgi:hypothetical protein
MRRPTSDPRWNASPRKRKSVAVNSAAVMPFAESANGPTGGPETSRTSRQPAQASVITETPPTTRSGVRRSTTWTPPAPIFAGTTIDTTAVCTTLSGENTSSAAASAPLASVPTMICVAISGTTNALRLSSPAIP